MIRWFLNVKMIGEGKLEELLEEMPTGQEELTRERRERLKEVLHLYLQSLKKMHIRAM